MSITVAMAPPCIVPSVFAMCGCTCSRTHTRDSRTRGGRSLAARAPLRATTPSRSTCDTNMCVLRNVVPFHDPSSTAHTNASSASSASSTVCSSTGITEVEGADMLRYIWLGLCDALPHARDERRGARHRCVRRMRGTCAPVHGNGCIARAHITERRGRRMGPARRSTRPHRDLCKPIAIASTHHPVRKQVPRVRRAHRHM